jgi:hypothetical protein
MRDEERGMRDGGSMIETVFSILNPRSSILTFYDQVG